MFIIAPSAFDPVLHLTQPVDRGLIDNQDAIKYFDKDGFELTPLEQHYYRANGVALTNYLWNTAAQKQWIELEAPHSSVFLDHSMLLERYQFEQDAKEQLINQAHVLPELWKLITTRRKWGIDFSVDYIADKCVTDVFHIEYDSHNLEQLQAVKAVVEDIAMRTDWVDAGKSLRRLESMWRSLEGKEQQNWKARYFGFDAAEVLCKTV